MTLRMHRTISRNSEEISNGFCRLGRSKIVARSASMMKGHFRGLLCRGLVFDDALHLMVAQGTPDAVLQRESVVSDPTGALWCVFGRKLNFTLDSVPASGTLDAALSKTAAQVNATFGIDRNIVDP